MDPVPCILIAGLSFLVGFKIAAWMGKRQMERLRKIWSAPLDGRENGEAQPQRA